MTALRLVVSDVSAEIAAAFSGKKVAAKDSMVGVIAIAATGAITEAADLLKTRGRANIAAAGFSRKWQNAWRVNVYPKGGGPSINAAAYAFHKIPYSLIYETGGTITAHHGKLWLPLKTAPKKVGRNKVSPRALAQSGVKLFSINRAGKPPLLAASVRNFSGSGAPSLSKLRSGVKGKRGEVRAIPLFVGVDSVHVRKRFNESGVADEIRAQIGPLYFKHLNAE